ncbi:chromosomal replication initiator protein DnaA [Helicobacter cholecystus]|uniref:Chromosomal replication initiator protein DnaA n=1 Tax=Helicobacter cholecystus TaxID=45498 RepID=A0A3D8IXN8_9HELI|nr:chromosomal replication initiator protein DnaA [Helicobacter cholecystus]RDU70028.1 chromosomal replication initiator protein DnaA [Helicobacter cholecystus]VEJ24803.1 chromosomal replication initiator protein [Helicobacter cholecystus]
MSIQIIFENLKSQVPSDEFERYFSKIEYDAETSKSDLLVFKVPNRFIASWIETKYSAHIASLWEDIYGVLPKIQILTQSQKQNVNNSTQEIIKVIRTQTFLNPDLIFDSFVRGESNKIAFDIAKNVSQNQAKHFNPVLIYGNTGLGKTHLLNAIGNEAQKQGKIVVYVSSEQFLNEYTNRINNNTMDRFREKYRQCDYLLIDDIQFFGGKDRTQEEFFHTFNELHNNQKQIVMTSDKPPRKIVGLEERLKSRFEGGMCVEIIPPEIELKIAIVKQKCQINHISIDNESIAFLATNVSNVRQIEGILTRLNAMANIMGVDISRKMVENAIRDNINVNNKNITLESIINKVARFLNIKPSEIRSKTRTKNIATARRYVIFLARELIPNSMSALAKELNMKDHSAVSKAQKKMEEEIEQSSALKIIIEDMKNQIQEEQNDKLS